MRAESHLPLHRLVAAAIPFAARRECGRLVLKPGARLENLYAN
jgi:hypothetical protein